MSQRERPNIVNLPQSTDSYLNISNSSDTTSPKVVSTCSSELFVAMTEDKLATETNSAERLSSELTNHPNYTQDEGALDMSNMPWDTDAVVDAESDTIEDQPPQPKTRKRKRKSIAPQEPTLLEPAEIVSKSRKFLRRTAKKVKAPTAVIVQPFSSDKTEHDEGGLHSASVEELLFRPVTSSPAHAEVVKASKSNPSKFKRLRLSVNQFFKGSFWDPPKSTRRESRRPPQWWVASPPNSKSRRGRKPTAPKDKVSSDSK
jgi:hypothetical protein